MIEIVEVRELAELAESLIKRTKPYVGAIEVGPNEVCSI